MPAPVSLRHVSRLAAALSLSAAAALPAQAASLSFSAQVSGQAAIVEVLDPNVPIVRAQTQASGDGSLGLLTYTSGDVLNMATGQGTGRNVFRTAQGDELWGDFTVQLVPGRNAGQFSLVGEVSFTGGTGALTGATGSAGFTGNAQFFSPTEALADFRFDGQLNTVSEPGTAALIGGGLLLAGARRRKAMVQPLNSAPVIEP